MSLNHKEIDAILDEIEFENSHLQKIRQPNYHSLYLEFYRPGGRYGINISLAPGRTRLHLVPAAPDNEVKLQRFAQFMRSRVRGARVIKAEQINNDRVIRLEMLRTGETIILWIRLWSGAANIIAADSGGRIMDAFYRRPGRGEVSGGIFRIPEPGKAKKEFYVRDLPGESSFNEKIRLLYESEEDESELKRLKDKIHKNIDLELSKAYSTLHKLENKTGEYEQFESYKQTGDLIMSNLHLIDRGDKWVSVNNYYSGNEETRIELDPLLSPEKNAEKYYNSYRKAKSGIEKVIQDTENIKLQIKSLENDRISIEQETVVAKLNEFVELKPRQKPQDLKERIPGLSYRSGPYTILVGRSAKENDQLLRKYVRGNDIWLHTRDYPGGYVFIKTIKGKSVPLENLLDAGNLALFYSKGKASGKGELYYTQVKYLRRAKDGPKGLVLPTQEKNLSIVLDQKRLDRMMNLDV